MSSEVAALPFQAHDNYRTWSIDFVSNTDNMKTIINPMNQGIKG